MVWTGNTLKHSTTCNHCGNDILDIDTETTNYHAHSMVVIVHKITPNGYQFYQTQSKQRVHRHNWNHWHCSEEHMYLAMPDHINKHTGTFADPLPGNIVNLHTVLEDDLDCVVCGKKLKQEAYRFFLIYATPVSNIIHNAADEEGWCCTLDHAKQHAIDKLTMLRLKVLNP